jgi:hypothetical protein
MASSIPHRNILIIGIGGFGNKAAIRLRGEVEKKYIHLEDHARPQVNLLSLDLTYPGREYFQGFPEEEWPENIYLKSEEQFFIGPPNTYIDTAWTKIALDSASGVPEAKELLLKQRMRIGMEAPFPSDYLAMLYESRSRFKEFIEQFFDRLSIQNKYNLSETSVYIFSSLIGNLGRQTYIPLIRILNDVCELDSFRAINSIFFTPEVFKNSGWLQKFHEYRYFAAIKKIHDFSETRREDVSQITQLLISLSQDQNFDSNRISPNDVIDSVAMATGHYLEINNSSSDFATEISTLLMKGSDTKVMVSRFSNDVFSATRELVNSLSEFERTQVKDLL